MRTSLAITAVMLAATVLAVPAAVAEPIAADPEGDAAFVVAGAPVSNPGAPDGGYAAPADLLALDVAEAEQEVAFAVSVKALDGTQYSAIYEIDFEWRGVAYQIGHYRSRFESLDQDYSRTALRVATESGFEEVAELTAIVDGATITIPVPKVYVLDAAARVPLKGEAITGLRVTSQGNGMAFGNLDSRVEDHLPDEGGLDYAFTRGGLATGHLALYSANPVRVSNGGATTFIYQATLRNQGDADDAVTLAVEELPAEWTATVRSPVTVPRGGEKTATVLATIPFAHEHGGFDSFALVATSGRDASARAVVRLGVLHTPIPMPAGHHPDVFLHAQPRDVGPSSKVITSVPGFLNTVDDHAGDTVYATPSTGSTSPASGESFTWWLPLAPALSMGLDFETGRTGTISGSVLGKRAGAGTVASEIWHSKEKDDGALLATANATSVAFDPAAASAFTLTVTPLPDSDYVPYHRDRNFWLKLVATRPISGLVCCPAETSPGLATTDFRMTLPLNEYRDRLAGGGDAAGGISLAADGPVERAGAPGSLLTYAFALRNAGSVDETVVLDLAGADAGLATVVPDSDVSLTAGTTRRVTLAVALPPDANDGQSFDVLVLAYSKADPAKLAVGRTLTTARAEAGATDERAVLEKARDENRGTPAVAIGLAAAAIALAARSRRGRAK